MVRGYAAETHARRARSGLKEVFFFDLKWATLGFARCVLANQGALACGRPHEVHPDRAQPWGLSRA
jgi:hypothetical protein